MLKTESKLILTKQKSYFMEETIIIH